MQSCTYSYTSFFTLINFYPRFHVIIVILNFDWSKGIWVETVFQLVCTCVNFNCSRAVPISKPEPAILCRLRFRDWCCSGLSLVPRIFALECELGRITLCRCATVLNFQVEKIVPRIPGVWGSCYDMYDRVFLVEQQWQGSSC